MANASAGHVGFAPEGSGGTYAAPAAYIPLTSESVREEYQRFPLYRLTPRNDRPDDAVGLHDIGGSIEGPWHPSVAPELLDGVLGGRTVVATGIVYRERYRTVAATPWDDRFPLQPYSMEINRDVGSAQVYSGVAFRTLDIGVAPNQEVRFELGLTALEVTDLAPTAPIMPVSSVAPLLFQSLSLEVAGAAFVDAEAFSYRTDNGIEPYESAASPDHYYGFRRESYQSHDWSMTLGFDTLEHLDRFRKQTEFPVRATFTAPDSSQLVIDMPRCLVARHRANLSGRGRVMLELEGECRYHAGSGTTADVTVAGVSGDLAYWWEPGIGRTDGWTFSSGGRPMQDDGLGNWSPVASGQRRIATTGPQAGFVSYDIARRNHYPDNSTNFVVVGSPGNWPKNSGGAAINGVGSAVTSYGLAPNGLPCVYLRWAGVATATGAVALFDVVGTPVAISEPWTTSFYGKTTAGTTAGLSFELRQTSRMGTTTVITSSVPVVLSPTTLQRYGATLFTTTTSQDNMRGLLAINTTSGATIDCTIMLAGMMLERSAVVGDPILTSGAPFGTNDEVETRAVPTDAEMAQGSMTIEFWHAGPMAARSARAFLYNWQSAGNNRLFVALPIGGAATAPATGQVVLGSGSSPVYFTPAIGRNIIGFTWGPATGLRVWLNGAYVGSIPYVAPMGAGVVERIGNAATVTGGVGAVAREPKAVIRYRDVLPDYRMQAITAL